MSSGGSTSSSAISAASPSSSAAGSTASSATTSGAATSSGRATSPASTCVTDPAAVVARQPTAQSTTADLPADLAGRLDAAAQQAFALAAAPGAIIGVRTPQGTWTAAYGLADPAAGTPMAVGMHTRIASLTKMYTGTLLLQLVQEGKVSLDDTIGEYVPGIPNGDRITLRQIGDMTSGIASYTASETFVQQFLSDPAAVHTPDELLAIGVAGSPLFEPGTGFNYSNTNTVLLGMVIEKVTGQDIATVLQERILTPLHLDETTWPGDSAAIPEPYARGFTLLAPTATPDAPVDSTDWNPSWGWTAGELISTTPDLLTMGRALGTGQGMLDPATQTLRLTSFPGASGYGFQMGCGNGWVGHTGDIAGYNTSLFYDTATDTTVSVQTNSDISSGDCAVSPTLQDNPSDVVCAAPAVRILVALTGVLGRTYEPPPAR
ncbi:beta-lactamase family protein [Nakamurella flava]|uniref:Beta-lactamase family protein n=2 Tax=Nakamurella flava TaxID=2576308 RepID=A0A4U6QQ30_9ACTN|nr:beta-lactamase family protein [Nakamurella flava]